MDSLSIVKQYLDKSSNGHQHKQRQEHDAVWVSGCMHKPGQSSLHVLVRQLQGTKPLLGTHDGRRCPGEVGSTIN